MAQQTNRDRIAREHEDRACGGCDGILRWYHWRGPKRPEAGGGYLHVRPNGAFYIAGHRPAPTD